MGYCKGFRKHTINVLEKAPGTWKLLRMLTKDPRDFVLMPFSHFFPFCMWIKNFKSCPSLGLQNPVAKTRKSGGIQYLCRCTNSCILMPKHPLPLSFHLQLSSRCYPIVITPNDPGALNCSLRHIAFQVLVQTQIKVQFNIHLFQKYTCKTYIHTCNLGMTWILTHSFIIQLQ